MMGKSLSRSAAGVDNKSLTRKFLEFLEFNYANSLFTQNKRGHAIGRTLVFLKQSLYEQLRQL